jgi:hypothetical protein
MKQMTLLFFRHCEEHSDEAIHKSFKTKDLWIATRPVGARDDGVRVFNLVSLNANTLLAVVIHKK